MTFVGGVARQSGMVEALKESLRCPVNVWEEPDLVVALGAALLALRRYEKLQRTTNQEASEVVRPAESPVVRS